MALPGWNHHDFISKEYNEEFEGSQGNKRLRGK